MAGGLDFAGMVPGFDFLQGLMKGAGAAMPAMGQWVAPTLDPAELDKRIGELRTVQFWLEQNAKLLGTTIQAMEVQRMTLATLQTMNLPMADLRDALSIKPAEAAAPAYAPRPAAPPAATPAPAEPVARVEAVSVAEEPEPAAAPAAAAVDPMKWWGALTQQFTEIASKAMQASAVPPVAAAAEAPAAAVAPATPARRRAAASPAKTGKKLAAKKAAPGTARARRA